MFKGSDAQRLSHGSARQAAIVFIAVFAFSFAYAFYTNQAWEDWFITFRVSKNLAMGNGLVYTVGERVHAFTSPLGTLVPALLSLVTGNRSDELVLWLFRIIGCGLLGLSAVMLLKIAQAAGMSLYPAALMVALFGVDAKIIAFSTNGMETAFMMFFLVSSLYLAIVPVRRYILLLGLTWAGLMWTRPDSFVYIGGLAMGYLLFKPDSPNFSSRREMALKFAKAGTVAAAFYLPWIAWAWRYYGSPIPHTVIAKGLHLRQLDAGFLIKLFTFPFQLKLDSPVVDTFMPPLYWLGGWPGVLTYASAFVGFVCAYYWCLPFGRPLGRTISFALCLCYFYLTHVVSFVGAWYIPSVTLLCILVMGHIAQHILDAAAQWGKGSQERLRIVARYVLYGLGGACLLASVLLTTAVAFQTKVQQDVVEEGQRKQIGLWLRDHAGSPLDTLFLECMGYIGYYSQMKLYDYPGLSSPDVVDARRRLGTDDFAALIQELRPTWLALRPVEVDAVRRAMPLLLPMNYDAVKVFDISDRLEAHPRLPGRQLLEWDRIFTVFRVKPSAPFSRHEPAAVGVPLDKR